eukprot:PhM_4_TR5422/c1_g1_i1/m.84256
MHTSHCRHERGSVFMKSPVTSTAKTWNPAMMIMMTTNQMERLNPLKMLTSSYKRRALNSLKMTIMTKALKTIVMCSVLNLCFSVRKSSPSFWIHSEDTQNQSWPKCRIRIVTTSWYSAPTRMKRHMRRDTTGALRGMGPRLRHASVGSSVDSDSAANVSMMRLTHSSCTDLSGNLPSALREPTNVSATHTTLTHSWNWRNLRMLSLTVRPHTTARSTERKLSSRSTMSADLTAMSVPDFMTKPTLASFNAGASFVPSPVTATTSPRIMSISTRSCLSRGWERASTVIFSRVSSSSLRSLYGDVSLRNTISRNVAPVMAMCLDSS